MPESEQVLEERSVVSGQLQLYFGWVLCTGCVIEVVPAPRAKSDKKYKAQSIAQSTYCTAPTNDNDHGY